MKESTHGAISAGGALRTRILCGGLLALLAIFLVACSDGGQGRKSAKKKKRAVAEKRDVSPTPKTVSRRKPAKKKAAVVSPQEKLRKEFRRRLKSAESEKEKTALAGWCWKKGLKKEAAGLARPLLEKEPDSPDLNRWVGNLRFDGEHPEYYGKWLSPEDHADAVKADKAYVAKLDADPKFMAMHKAVQNLKNDYLKDYKTFSVMEWPYVLMIESFGSKKQDEHYAAENRSRVRAFYRYMKKTYPDLVTREPAHPFRIIVLKDGKSFNKFNARMAGGAREPGVRAYYHILTKFIYTYEKMKGSSRAVREFSLGVLFHECTHQFLGFLRPKNNIRDSMWFEEALAEFHGGVRTSGRGKDGLLLYTLGELNNLRLAHVKYALKVKRYFDLPTLFRCRTYDEADATFRSRFGLRGSGKSLLYCQGWSFIYFCMKGPNPKCRKAMLDYIKMDVGDGDGEYGSMLKAFGLASDDQWKPIEREWKAFVNKLKVERGKSGSRKKPGKKKKE